jgi:ABC-type sugar transport system permease subunit
MLEKILILCLITLLVFFVYDFVRNVWTVDICFSYYQKYGNYNYTNPLTNQKTTTFDCYHEALNYMSLYVVVIVFISMFIGLLIAYFNEFSIAVERKKST